MKKINLLMTGLKTHGGPGAIRPRIFQIAPQFEPPTYIYQFGPQDFYLGPRVLKSKGPRGPREKYGISNPVTILWLDFVCLRHTKTK